jgi:hypothetical protein
MTREALTTSASPHPRRRSFRSVMARGCRLLAACVAALAIAACDAGPPSSSDGGPMGGAEAARQEIARAMVSTPLPPGATFRPIPIADDEQYQAGFGTQTVQFQSICSWYRYWLEGIRSGDEDRQATASRAAQGFKTMELYIASDVSFRDLTDRVLAAAALGDAGPMDSFVENNCG